MSPEEGRGCKEELHGDNFANHNHDSKLLDNHDEIDMEETLRPDNISFFVDESSLNSTSNSVDDNDHDSSRTGSRSDAKSGSNSSIDSSPRSSSRIPVSNSSHSINGCQQSTNCAANPVQHDESPSKAANPVQSLPMELANPAPSNFTKQPSLRPSQVKSRDSLLRSQRTKARAALNQQLRQQQEQLNSHLANPGTNHVAKEPNQDFDPRKYFRRQNSLPSHIPKMGRRTSSSSSSDNQVNPVTLTKRTQIYSPLEGKAFPPTGFTNHNQANPLSPSSPGFYQMFGRSLRLNGEDNLGDPVASRISRPMGPPPPYDAHHHTISVPTTTRFANPVAGGNTGFFLHDSPQQLAQQLTQLTNHPSRPQHLVTDCRPGAPGLSELVNPVNKSQRSASLTNGFGFDDRYPMIFRNPDAKSSSTTPTPTKSVNPVHQFVKHRSPSSAKSFPMYNMDEMSAMVNSPKLLNQNLSPYFANQQLTDYRISKSQQSSHSQSRFANHSNGSLSSPERRSAAIFNGTGLKPRSASDHQLSNLLINCQKQSLNRGPVAMAAPKKPPRSNQPRPWSHLVTDLEVQQMMIENDARRFSAHGQGEALNGGLNSVLNSVRRNEGSKSETDVHREVDDFELDLEHLEPSTDVDTMMQKFKKSFSLRFSRFGSTRNESVSETLI